MVFTKRERIILIVTVAIVAALGMDWYVLTPLLAGYEETNVRKASLQREMAQSLSLMKRGKLLAPKWRGMLIDGLKRDPTETESQTLRAVRTWASEARLSISSLKPERSRESLESRKDSRANSDEKKPRDKLREITFHVAGTGSMAAVSRFLWLAETSKIPMKVRMLQLGARKEGTDSLTLQLHLSTIYLAPPTPKASEGRDK